jgi:hypothetical protein
MYPASLPDADIVTVGSSTAGDTISPFSSYGATSVDLFAPGQKVLTTWNDGGFRVVDGTSIAAPQVAAAYALYRAAWPDATAPELKQALLDDVDPVPAFAGKSVTGGRLSIGSLADGALGAVRYTFTSMTAPAGVVEPGVTATGDDASGAYSVALGLGMEQGGEVYALSGKDVTLAGTTLTTDDSGEALFSLGTGASLSGLDLSPSMDLGDGRYVLTVQLYRDGTILGRTFAAPLLVGTAVTAPTPSTPGTPGTGTPGTPGTSTPGTPGTGTPGTPDTGTPGTETPGTPGTGTPGTPGTSTPGTGTPGTGTPGTPGTGTPGPPGTGTPGTGTPGTGTPGNGAPSPGLGIIGDGTPSPGTGPGASGTGTPPAPGKGGSVSFPGTGAFGITSLNPAIVDTAGGTLVTITGTSLPANPRVRIGDSATASVVSSSSTSITFRTPARAAGVYDVHVFATDGTEQILTGALTYVDAAAAGGSDTGAGTPGTGPGTAPGTGADPGTDTGGSGSGTSPGSDPGTGPGAGSGTPGPGSPGSGGSGTRAPVVVTGPNGERLVRTAKFAGLGGIWAMDCSTSCSGVAI